MTEQSLIPTDPVPQPTLGASRARVLDVLQDSAEPMTVDAVAGAVGLHPNTARFHLDGLVRSRLATRTNAARHRPGRPPTLYRAIRGGARAGTRSYRLLAEILTGYLAAETTRPGRAAEAAGHAWGRYLADRPPPFRRPDAGTATRQLVRTLDDIGFAPEDRGSDGDTEILLHHCPFREAAEQHREVVCGIHLGLMRGVLAELDAPVEVTALEPFVEPNLCITRLRTRRPGTEAAEPRPRSAS